MLFTVKNREEENKESCLSPSLTNMKDSKELLYYLKESMKSDPYSHDSDADERKYSD